MVELRWTGPPLPEEEQKAFHAWTSAVQAELNAVLPAMYEDAICELITKGYIDTQKILERHNANDTRP